MIALLMWGDLVEDFLDPIDVSMDTFVGEMTGGWLFGYVEALARVHVSTAVICVTARVSQPVRRVHRPTGAPIWFLPASAAYRRVRRWLPAPYATDRTSARQDLRGLRAGRAMLARHVAPYLATPALTLARILRQEGCRAILVQEYEEARFDVCVLLGRMLHIPVYATFQGGDRHRSALEPLIRPHTLGAAAGLIVASRSERERLTARYRLPAARIAAIFNPLDLAQWPPADRAAARVELGLPLEAKVAVWHGRVDIRPKGLDVLVDAWELTCRARPDEDLRLLVVGGGADDAEFRAVLAERQITGLFWRAGYVVDRDQIRPYLDAADMYVFPSRHEGFPVAVIEAMACGLPVLAADAPGVRDILAAGAGDGGVIVPRGDPQALAAGMSRMLDDLSECRRLGIRARARVEDAFSPDAVGEQLRAVLTRAPARVRSARSVGTAPTA
ncbi:MAG: glycosyltransferase family 4 protein [Geodermatophilaceae bacterium]|nr:glycosyltransferase family 4 protein [Geodermatophilaceae bacterium]MDQ3455290.1 glycosyltransferase family 4 protein [Actinomycetota bacterium]